MDIGELLSFANAFSHAIVSADRDLIASYVCEEAEADLDDQLGILPPLDMAKVLLVTPLGDTSRPLSAKEFVSVINFWGKRDEVLLRAVWVQNAHQPLVRKLQVVECKGKGQARTTPLRASALQVPPDHQRVSPNP